MFLKKYKKLLAGALLALFFIFLLYQSEKLRFYYEYSFYKLPVISKILPNLNKIDSSLDEIDFFKKIIHSKNKANRLDIKMSSDDIKEFEKERSQFIDLGFQRGELKKWRKVEFIIDGKNYIGKLKLHGNSVNPILEKFSFKIKLKKTGDHFNGKRRFNLIHAKYDLPLSVIVPNIMAKKENLLSPIGRYLNVFVNGAFYGSFFMSDVVEKEILETDYKITDYAIFKPNDDWDRMRLGHSSYLDLESENMEIDGEFSDKRHAFSRIDDFFNQIKNETIFQDSSLFDIDYFAKFLALQALTSESHNAGGDNLKLLYNARDGKIYPIFRNETKSAKNILNLPRNPYKTIENFNLLWLKSYYKDTNESLYINEAPAMKIYELFLRNGNLRARRDYFLYKYLNENLYTSTFKEAYEENKSALLSGDQPKRILNYDIWASRKYHEQIKKLASEYLEYAKLFASYDPINNKLKIINDSYQPVKIEHIEYIDKNGMLKSINFNKILDAPNLDQKITIIKKKYKFDIDPDIIEIKKIVARNLTSNKLIENNNIYLTEFDDSYAKKKNYYEVLENNQILFEELFVDKKRQIKIKSGTYTLKENLIFENNLDVFLEAGVNLQIINNASILIRGNVLFDGKKNNKIFISSLKNNNFGSIIIMGSEGHKTKINNTIIIGGSDTNLNGIHSSAALMIHDSDIEIFNSRVSKSSADDGLNARFSTINIQDSTFSFNSFDQIDLDFCTGILKNNTFIGDNNENGDGLDLSGSKVHILNNKFTNFIDKALSIGERSKACISNNEIRDANIGIASKDDSIVLSTNNSYVNVNEENKMYLKKKMYEKSGVITEKVCDF